MSNFDFPNFSIWTKPKSDFLDFLFLSREELQLFQLQTVPTFEFRPQTELQLFGLFVSFQTGTSTFRIFPHKHLVLTPGFCHSVSLALSHVHHPANFYAATNSHQPSPSNIIAATERGILLLPLRAQERGERDHHCCHHWHNTIDIITAVAATRERERYNRRHCLTERGILLLLLHVRERGERERRLLPPPAQHNRYYYCWCRYQGEKEILLPSLLD
jgi:hypothetical protein